MFSWKLQFLKSEFKGQLPQPFLDHENATSVIQPYFNDMNREEPTRYVSYNSKFIVLGIAYHTERLKYVNIKIFYRFSLT